MAQTAVFAADFTKWNAALANAKDGLKSFEVSSKGVQAQLQRMASSFSGVQIQKQAQLAAAAIEKVGGATKLTASEQTKANAIVQEAIEKYKALGQQAPESVSKLSAELKKLNAENAASAEAANDSGLSFTKLAGSYLTAQLALNTVSSGLKAVGQLVSDSIQSYANAEAAQSKLTAALRTQGQATPAVIDHYNDLAASIQNTTAFSDDLTNSAEALLVQIGDVMPAQMDKAIHSSADLAAGLGIDLEQAATLVAKAVEGNVGALGRYGIKIDEAAVAAQGADAVFAAVEKHFGGQAQAQLDTYTGKVAFLANAWDNLKEAIGKFVVTSPIVDAGIGALADALNKAGDAGSKATLSWSEFLDILKKIPGPLAQMAGQWAPIIAQLEKVAEAVNAANGALRHIEEEQSKNGSPLERLLTGTAGRRGAAPNATAISDPAVARLFDAWVEGGDKAKEAAKQFAAEVAKLREQLSGAALEGDLRKVEAAWRGLTVAQQRDPLVGGRLIDAYSKLRAGLHALPADLEAVRAQYLPVIESARVLNTQWLAYIALAPDVENGTKRVSNVLHDLNANGTLLSHGLKDSYGRLVDFNVQMKATPGAVKSTEVALKLARSATVDWGQQLDELSGAFSQLAQVSGGSFAGVVKAIGSIISAMSLANKASHQFKSGLEGIASSFIKETHGGITQTAVDWEHLAGAITQTATAAIAAAGAIAQATAQGSKSQRVLGGVAAGAEAGAAFGGAGAVVGAAIGAFVGFYRAEQAAEAAAAAARVQISQLGGSIQKTFGTMKLASEIAVKFGVNLQDALARGGPEGAALLQQAFETLTAKQDHLNELLETYNIDWKKLGPAFQASHILENVNQLNQDWSDLAGAGVPLDTIIGSMAGKINDFLKDALASGQKLPKQFQPIIEQLIRMGKITDDNARKLLGMAGEADVDFQHMEDLAKKYGISLQALGPKFQAAKIHAAAQDIIDDFTDLIDSGADVGGVLDGMSDEISALVQQAIKSGVALPDTMKPWIEQLLAAGELVDGNGDKLKDLSGINFEKPLTKAVDDLISKLDQLIDKLGDVYGSIEKIPNSIDVGVHYTSDGQIQLPGGGSVPIPPNPDQTHGGGGSTPTGPGNRPGQTGPTGGHYAMGGIIRAQFGRLLPFSPRYDTDRVPFMATEGERILSVPQTQRIDQWLRGMDRANAGGTSVEKGAGDVLIIPVRTSGHHDRDADAIWDALPTAIKQNKRGLRTKIRQALETVA